jgi:hypothetical protein
LESKKDMEKSRGMIKAFEDLEVWNRACQLYLDAGPGKDKNYLHITSVC